VHADGGIHVGRHSRGRRCASGPADWARRLDAIIRWREREVFARGTAHVPG